MVNCTELPSGPLQSFLVNSRVNNYIDTKKLVHLKRTSKNNFNQVTHELNWVILYQLASRNTRVKLTASDAIVCLVLAYDQATKQNTS